MASVFLREQLDQAAAQHPDRVYAVFEDGEQITFEQLRSRVVALASSLQALGVTKGQVVLCMMPNSLRLLEAWYALNYLGAVFAPLNTAYKGRMLENAIALLEPELAFVSGTLIEQFNAATMPRTVIVDGNIGTFATSTANRVMKWDELRPADPVSPVALSPGDTQMIIFTSGTTGASKGVMVSYAQHHAFTTTFGHLAEDDRFLANLPLYHIAGTMPCQTMLWRGGSIAMPGSFSSQKFWQYVRDSGTTFAVLLGAMASFLARTPSAGNASGTKLKRVSVLPFGQEALEFQDRFRLPIMTQYSMSELSCPLVSADNPTSIGICGTVRPGYELRLVDDQDNDVPGGEAGELLVRAADPLVLTTGYYRNPAATAEAMRNGWFHTGDVFRRNERGEYFFVDRKKDVIRRRGENISSVELEAEVCAHPGVLEGVAVPVPSEHGEDDVLIVFSPRAGVQVKESELIDFLTARVPRYMIPRFVRISSGLPKTLTHKIRKALLRDEGVTAETWDASTSAYAIVPTVSSRADDAVNPSGVTDRVCVACDAGPKGRS
ncbi:AMP-binding protein [Paraburkholderia rhynchosiae]|uniref:ATP-dependent acyl-CoA ligase n=1 Tax=Paraburkholderia rhynchosiae TaxID=487049 RepID=A0A2N7W7X2_9BURK|nr:AMP-binding protein [Paraburkholderia rhynchosiae]PMS25492.1 ATP-dependent acyl-CoA ligase [Paraburkholderia rhynchosiae]CAB3733905.1 Crotonobetaine/carnitine--CoA ligase [Paraburkholderia rhynchosiae]